MLNLNSIIIFSENPKVLVDFYKKVLQKDPGWTGGEFVGWQAGSGYLTIGPHSKVHGKSTNPERLMFFFETKDVAGEFTRLKGLGATVVAEPYQPGEEPKMWLATLADPDGNYFQLVTPMKMVN
ncbi:VOC family protein [Candidatus Gottesmanbacteria bacterium]|nr:VOC family protein [Candidatus Gottesmanbacteria bacterium]